MSISSTHSGHGDNEKVDTFPIGNEVAIIEIEWIARVFEQMYEAGSGDPHRHADRHELSEPNRGGRLQHVQILQNVGKRHQPKCT